VKKLIVVFALLLVIPMLAVPASSVYAAARTVTVKITEDQINAYIRRNGFDRSGDLTDAHVIVQESQLAVAANFNTPGLAPARIAIGVVPSINNGVVNWAYSVVVYNDQAYPPDQFRSVQDPTTAVNTLLRPFLRLYNLRGLQPTSITLTNHTI
jgi:hypothetical protein